VALGAEVHGDGLVEVRVGHLPQLLLQLPHGLIEGHALQLQALMLGLDL
jgi:hypothetical protein